MHLIDSELNLPKEFNFSFSRLYVALKTKQNRFSLKIWLRGETIIRELLAPGYFSAPVFCAVCRSRVSTCVNDRLSKTTNLKLWPFKFDINQQHKPLSIILKFSIKYQLGTIPRQLFKKPLLASQHNLLLFVNLFLLTTSFKIFDNI